MKKKPSTPESEVHGYQVKISQYCDYSEHSEEEYGSWEESYSNSFESCTKTNSQFADVYSSVDTAKTGGYLVWVEYSTGDSFGHSDRGSVESIAIFEKAESAQQLKNLITQWDQEYRRNEGKFEYSREVEIEGQKLKIFCPWTGYFEHLEEVHIQKI
jgi:hypothetical protein